jgi:hypothetical protein
MKFRELLGKTTKNLYSKKLGNLEDLSKFLVVYKLPKFNQEDIKYLNISVINHEIGIAIKSLSTKKSL